MAEEIAAWLKQAETWTLPPFAVISPETGRAVGVSGSMTIDVDNGRLEIGPTRCAAYRQRTGVNVESRRAIEGLAMERDRIPAQPSLDAKWRDRG
ncbi:hypothetical protein [Rhodoblastus sp.]|uniref:hypothetical protein n=1 Tax=Rhodoblastus sp. TaxID=1962975 RepID=UPI003F9AA9F3